MTINVNSDIIKGKMKQFKGDVKAKWGELTDDEITKMEGNRDKLVGTVQEKYGMARAEAEEEVKSWEKSCGCSDKH